MKSQPPRQILTTQGPGGSIANTINGFCPQKNDSKERMAKHDQLPSRLPVADKLPKNEPATGRTANQWAET